MSMPLDKSQSIVSSEVPGNYSSSDIKEDNLYLTVKRFFDIALSLIGLPVALLLIFTFGALIRLDSKGPWLYCQERVGKNGMKFKMFKLRSMYVDAELDGPKWAQKNDIRITRIGRFIRGTRIDEIPQIINILRGEMSIVGPRPERSYFVDQFEKELPQYSYRLKIKPGLTGMAQVNGGYDLDIKEKLELDLFYIHNLSLWLDLQIIFKTFKVVLYREGAR